jgi:hypothetical protein
MRFEAEGTEEQRIGSGVRIRRRLARPVSARTVRGRSAFGTALHSGCERREKEAQAVDRCELAMTPERIPERAQRRPGQQGQRPNASSASASTPSA